MMWSSLIRSQRKKRGSSEDNLRLSVHSSQRYLINPLGAPVQLRGSSTWCLVQSDRSTIDYVLSNTAGKKFNSVVVMSALSENANSQYGPTQAYGTFPFSDSKLTPSEAHWQNLDYLIRKAASLGLIVQLAYLYVGHPSSQDGFASRIAGCTEQECFDFGAFLGARYRNTPNLIWISGGDNMPETDQDKWDAIVDGILSQDTTHLITGHPQRGEEGRLFGSYITLNSVYRNRAELVAGTLAAYSGSPTLPAFLFEGVYAGDGTPWSNPTLTPAQTRPQLWHALLSGGCGANHGNHEVWTCGWVSGSETYPGWLDELDAADHVAMTHIANFFDAIPWWTLSPDSTSTFVTAGRSSGETYVAAAFTSMLGIAIIPDGGQITVDMSEFSGSVTGWWFDPTSGAYTVISGSDVSPFNNSGTRNFDPPLNAAGETDMVLLLRVM